MKFLENYMNLFEFIGNGYQTVILSFISSIFLLTCLIFYVYIFPRRKISLLTLLIFSSLLPIVIIFRPGLYESGDFNIHIYRSIEFYKSLTEGYIMPSWAGKLNATYGYPLFIFNYTFPYYIVSLLHFLGFSFVDSMKIFLASSYLTSGIFMFYASRKLFRNETAAFISAIFYQFAPYHLVDLNFKVAFGELTIFTMIPMLFLLLQKLWERRNILFFSLAAFSGSLLIMSHTLIAFSVIGFICIYATFLTFIRKDNYYFFSSITVFILSCLSSLHMWLAPLYMNQFTITSKMTITKNIVGMDFWDMIYSPWKMGFLFQGPNGEINTPLGFSQIFIVLVLIIYIYKRKINSRKLKYISFWIVSFFIIFFFATKQSSFIWSQIKIPILMTIPDRLPILLVLILSILAGYFSMYFIKKKFFFWIMIIFTIFSTILNWGQRRVIATMGEQNLIENLPYSTYQAEGHWYADSKWRNVNDLWFKVIPTQHLEVLKGIGNVKEIKRESEMHSYIISANTNLKMRENTLYFPGWQVTINDVPVLTSPDKDGLIIFDVPKGLHYIKLEYRDIPIYKNMKILSLIFFISLIFLSVWNFIKMKKIYKFLVFYGRIFTSGKGTINLVPLLTKAFSFSIKVLIKLYGSANK